MLRRSVLLLSLVAVMLMALAVPAMASSRPYSTKVVSTGFNATPVNYGASYSMGASFKPWLYNNSWYSMTNASGYYKGRFTLAVLCPSNGNYYTKKTTEDTTVSSGMFSSGYWVARSKSGTTYGMKCPHCSKVGSTARYAYQGITRNIGFYRSSPVVYRTISLY